MEKAATVRQAALNAIEDVEPAHLRERIEQRIDDGSMAPGVLTLCSAQAADESVSLDGIADRAAGVQLIYEGLRLTRSLAHAQPWTDADDTSVWRSSDTASVHPATATATATTTDSEKLATAAAADIDILVADILVARGFYLLARTDAATAAVSVVQSFGHDQTIRRETDNPALDANLEADVFELAVVAGTTAAGSSASVQLREFAADLATTDGEFPAASVVLPESVSKRLAALAGPDATPHDHEGTWTSADQ